MKIHRDIEQGSLAWEILRSGRATASGLKNILTPSFKIRTGEMPYTYTMQVLAEQWQGGALPQESFGTFEMEQGVMIEQKARDLFMFETGKEIEKVAFIEADDARFGASPDGLVIGAKEGLELKAPKLITHLKYLDRGEVPEEYLCQVHGSIYASGFDRWHFMSYRHGFPPLILTVERDEKIMAIIKSALESFFEQLDKAMDKLIKLNGGIPIRKSSALKPFPKQPTASIDVLP
jgi:hypothetical protein